MGGRGQSSEGGIKKKKVASPWEQPDIGNGKRQLTQEEADALYEYTKSSHVNAELAKVKGDVTQLDSQWAEMVKNLDSGISKFGWNKTEDAPQYGTVALRGGGAIMVGVPESLKLSAQGLADYINANLIGVDATNVGYTSITRTPNVAENFAAMYNNKNPVILDYASVDDGVRGVYISGGQGKTPISDYKTYEDETLLQRNIVTTPRTAYVGSDGYCHVVVDIRAKGRW